MRFFFMVVASVLTLNVGAVAQSYVVSPLTMEMVSAGAKEALEIRNTGRERVTLSFSAHETSVNAAGERKAAAPSEDFIIFPPQLILAPGATRRVQIQYVAPLPVSSKIYHIVTEQVPVNLSGDGPGMSVGFNYVTLVTVGQ